MNVGGQDDSNDNITRRVLYLLEGNWLRETPPHLTAALAFGQLTVNAPLRFSQ